MLSITNLVKRYGDITAVSDVSFTVPRGRIIGFVGPNGAGKSTTMRSIFGLVEPDEGEITWDGEAVTTAHLDRFGYMPEQRGLYPKMKIRDQIAFFAELKQTDRKTALSRAATLLESLDLGDRLDDPLEKLSHGNQQRVQLAASLVNDPELLVLDEPFNGLDPVAVSTLQDALVDRVREGAGALFSSHQLDLVERICDELVIIVNGEIKAAGSVADVRGASGTRHLTIEVDRPIMPLSDALAEAVDPSHIVATNTKSASVSITSDDQLAALLDRASAAGSITRFDYDLPSLQSAFAAIAGLDATTGLEGTGDEVVAR